MKIFINQKKIKIVTNVFILGVVCFFLVSCSSQLQQKKLSSASNYISLIQEEGSFVLAQNGYVATLVISDDDNSGVKRIAEYVQQDLEKVTTKKPELFIGKIPVTRGIILAGTLGESSLVDQLVKQHKIDVSEIKGKWESTITQVVEQPFPGIESALVIVGSDKRGTIYGLFDLSRNIGVSPWYWWADVPVPVQKSLFVKRGRYLSGEPKVKYRGIFLNDEEPALGRWAVENYSGFNHQFYEKAFELILRLKGNYIWPAMWWASFNSDDTINPILADEMGIVVGTTHHEPMMRAHAEWKPYGGKAWDYETNEEQLREFWEEGIERMDGHESIVTVGMRGDGDMAMNAETNIALLERIVSDQRTIIEKVTDKPIEETPQLWALYKEVQDYYDRGMRVPDDVTLLLCDDNWGNIRKLPKFDAAPRSGGYGIYYHFDYVGGPRNYKWLNTSPLPRVWEQMHLAYKHGVDRIWLVNVGDLKPMELPISFFLDYAWDPDAMPKEQLAQYTVDWAAEQFGPEYAEEIGRMLRLYSKYNGRRKPELLSPETYSLDHSQEFERIVENYKQLVLKAEELSKKLPAAYQDAYYELVLHPIMACANLNELYYAAAKNRQAVSQGRATANNWADLVSTLFQKDLDITNDYHTKLASGKWNHMMAQTHIGYTYWQQPEHNNMPKVEKINLPKQAEMGVAIQGEVGYWTAGKVDLLMPEMDVFNQQSVYIDLFNRGQEPFDFEIGTDQSWVKVKPAKGVVNKEQRVWLTADWNQVPVGEHKVTINIKQVGGKEITAIVVVNRPVLPDTLMFKGFIESNGFVAIEAAHFTRNYPANNIQWEEIPGLGRTLSAMTPFPVTAKAQIPGTDNPHLEYDMYLYHYGNLKVNLYLSPSLNYYNDEGLQLAVSFDDQQPTIIHMNQDNSQKTWEGWVSNNLNKQLVHLQLEHPGKHTLKVWMVNPGVVLQKIVVETALEKSTYLGGPESFLINN